MSAAPSLGSGVLAAASAAVEKNANLCPSPPARRASDASGTTIRGSSALAVCAAAGATRATERPATRSRRILKGVSLMVSYAQAHFASEPGLPRFGSFCAGLAVRARRLNVRLRPRRWTAIRLRRVLRMRRDAPSACQGRRLRIPIRVTAAGMTSMRGGEKMLRRSWFDGH
jgi:hypothetical protein